MKAISFVRCFCAREGCHQSASLPAATFFVSGAAFNRRPDLWRNIIYAERVAAFRQTQAKSSLFHLRGLILRLRSDKTGALALSVYSQMIWGPRSLSRQRHTPVAGIGSLGIHVFNNLVWEVASARQYCVCQTYVGESVQDESCEDWNQNHVCKYSRNHGHWFIKQLPGCIHI